MKLLYYSQLGMIPFNISSVTDKFSFNVEIVNKDIINVIEYEKQHPKCKLMYGFNHRYHESVQDAQSIIGYHSLKAYKFPDNRFDFEKEHKKTKATL